MNISSLKSLYNINAVQTINEFKKTDSTNTRAKEDIRNFIDDENWKRYNIPSLYIADMQTAGRGRSERIWESENEAGIWMSYLFAPKLSPEQIPSVTLLASLAVADAITEYSERHRFKPSKIQIKWPNDIIINKKKVCGILTELIAPNYVICGIGINVNNTSFDASLSDKATSLFIETGENWSRETLVYLVIRKFSNLVSEYEKHGNLNFILKKYNSMLVSMNSEVVIVNSTAAEGNDTTAAVSNNAYICRGIKENGALLIEDNSGNISSVSSGEVSVRGIYGYV